MPGVELTGNSDEGEPFWRGDVCVDQIEALTFEAYGRRCSNERY
jgi:hypothetical protein